MGQVIDLQEWHRRRSQVPAKAAERPALWDATGIVWMEPILSSSLLWHSMVTMWVGLWFRRDDRPAGASGRQDRGPAAGPRGAAPQLIESIPKNHWRSPYRQDITSFVKSYGVSLPRLTPGGNVRGLFPLNSDTVAWVSCIGIVVIRRVTHSFCRVTHKNCPCLSTTIAAIPRVMYALANPLRFRQLTDPMLPWLLAGLAVLLPIGLVWGLWIAPPDYQQGDSYRIMFVHVPAAWMAMQTYALIAIASVAALIWRHPLAEVAARAAAPIGACFTVVALFTGSVWGKPTWGTYWVWDARLTSFLILLFLYLGYMALLDAFDDATRGARAAVPGHAGGRRGVGDGARVRGAASAVRADAGSPRPASRAAA